MKKFILRQFHKQSALRSRNNGFTMIEIAVVAGLISVMAVILADVFMTHGRFYNIESTQADLQLRSVQTINIMGKMIKLADQVMANRMINSKDYTTSAETLILELPAVTSDGKVIEGSYDYAVFYVDPSDNQKIMLSLEPNPLSHRVLLTKLLTESGDHLKFTYDNKDYEQVRSVLVELSLAESVLNDNQSVSLNRKINLGNKD